MTSVSSATLCTLWWMFTPTRTTLGVKALPSLSVRPEVISRSTISSSAELAGAHTWPGERAACGVGGGWVGRWMGIPS